MNPATHTEKEKPTQQQKPNTPNENEIPMEEPLPNITKMNMARIIQGNMRATMMIGGK